MSTPFPVPDDDYAFPHRDPQAFPHTREQELADLRRVCKTLWPAVRFFGLCGAEPIYVQAVAELGRLLGKASGDIDAEELAERSREAMAQHIAEWVETAPEVRGKVGLGLAREFAALIKEMK